ncbi:MAG TPA: acyltransferase [Thermomonospora sp.]|nr:acyltransferase [Thermomonospora sp.]
MGVKTEPGGRVRNAKILRAADLAARTPGDRDRYVDFLRVFSLAAVVAGHWLMAVVPDGSGGPARAGNALAIMPSLQPLTWLFQVMPLFFAVGGFSHATALRRDPSYGEFVRARAARLLIPTAVFAGVWLAAALVIEVAGRDTGVLRLATRVVAQPLWFVGVYLGVVAFAPLMWRLHRSHGAAVPVVLGAGVVAVDVLRFRYGVDAVASLNLLLVWLAVHQLGFFHADGGLGRRPAGALAAGGLTAMLALIALGPYPLSMVGMPGAEISNMSPPTLALFAHGLWLVGLAMLLRGPVTRLLHRPRVWVAVIAANGIAMTAFLWHLTALFLVCAAQIALGWAQPPVGGAAWWLLRPVWIGLLAVVTAALVAVFRRADRPRRLAPRAYGTVRNVTGMVLCLVGILGLSAVGFGGALAGRTATLVALPVTPLRCALLLTAGGLLLGLIVRDGPETR